jgi:hypothetical protein
VKRSTATQLLSLLVVASASTATPVPVAGAADAPPVLGAPLFPVPFRVEHHLVQTDQDGGAVAMPPVTDFYGGSWVVSVHPDGSRLIVDLVRREITEVRPAASTYATLGFDRLAEIRRRLRAAGARPAGAGSAVTESRAGASTATVATMEVERLPGEGNRPGSVRAAGVGADLLRLRVTAGAAAAPVEVWCDPRVRLSGRAQAALDELESRVLGDPHSDVVTPAAMVAAARAYAQGAFPVRTVRRAGAGEWPLTIEDVTTTLAPLDCFPVELVKVPDGYRRVPHPLEALAAFEEHEAGHSDQPSAGR